MKQALVVLIVGTVLSGLAAAYAATIQHIAGTEVAVEAPRTGASD